MTKVPKGGILVLFRGNKESQNYKVSDVFGLSCLLQESQSSSARTPLRKKSELRHLETQRKIFDMPGILRLT